MDSVDLVLQPFLVAMGSAAHIASTVAAHRREDSIVYPHDIVAGLIYRLMTEITQDEIDTQLQRWNDDEENLDVPLTEMDDPKLHENHNLTIASYTCNCEVCARMRVCIANYNNYECPEPLSELMKRSIEETRNKHKVYVNGN